MVCKSRDFKCRDYDCKGKALADVLQRMKVHIVLIKSLRQLKKYLLLKNFI